MTESQVCKKRCAAKLCDRSACLQHARPRKRSSKITRTRTHGDRTPEHASAGDAMISAYSISAYNDIHMSMSTRIATVTGNDGHKHGQQRQQRRRNRRRRRRRRRHRHRRHWYVPWSLPPFLPSYLPTFPPPHLPTFLLSYPPTFLPSYLPTFLPSYLPTYIHVPSYLPTILPPRPPISPP